MTYSFCRKVTFLCCNNTRGENSTVEVVEKKLALLEKGEKAHCFSSGMGA